MLNDKDTMIERLSACVAEIANLTGLPVTYTDFARATDSVLVHKFAGLHRIIAQAKSFVDANGAVAKLPPLLKVYYIPYEDEDGNNHDCFVRATSPEAAHGFWKQYLIDQGVDEIVNRVHVYETPLAEGRYGVVEWGDVRHTTFNVDGTRRD
jgi:hypothetical protein